VQPETPKAEPIEQVFSQEPEDVKIVEPSIESEDQDRFEETAKFEEDIDTSKVEPKPERKQARKSKVARKSHVGVNEDKPISKLHDDRRKHSEARRKAEREILDIRKELKDLLLVHTQLSKIFKNKYHRCTERLPQSSNSSKFFCRL